MESSIGNDGGLAYITNTRSRERAPTVITEEEVMKVWMKPQVREQEVGLEVTSYLPAEIDVI
jgi:coenzyme PQQ precursor peptide PqqA